MKKYKVELRLKLIATLLRAECALYNFFTQSAVVHQAYSLCEIKKSYSAKYRILGGEETVPVASEAPSIHFNSAQQSILSPQL